MNNIQSILTRAQAAMGGKSLVASIQTLDALASCAGPNGRFSTRIYSAKDGRMTMFQGDENGRRLLAGIDAVDSWAFRPDDQSFSSLQPVSLTFLRGHELHMLALAPQTRFGQPAWQGETTFAGKTAVTLRFQDQLDGDLDIHYASESGLPLGLTQKNHTGRGADTVEVRFSDWQSQSNELKLFTKAEFVQGDDLYAYEFMRLSANSVPDSLLQSPERHPDGVDAALLRHLHDQQQTAHLTYDAGLFTAAFHDPLTQVSGGEVHTASQEASQARFQAYFDQVQFIAWEDVSPPLIRVSADGSMATNIVHKRVHLTAENADGQRQEGETIFVWLESWEKVAGQWLLMAIASTNK